MPNVYQRNGYQNRKHYLKRMAEDFGVQPQVVFSLAELLGPDEDFDALPQQLDDYSSMIHFTQGEPL